MMMMNCFCGMVDRQKAFSLISSWDHCQRSSPLQISDAVSRVWTYAEPEFRLSWMKLCICDNHYTTAPGIIVRKTKNNKEIHSSTWPWKELWLFMKFKWNFRLLDNFFLYKNLTFPLFYNSLLFGIPSHCPFNKSLWTKESTKRSLFGITPHFIKFCLPLYGLFWDSPISP